MTITKKKVVKTPTSPRLRCFVIHHETGTWDAPIAAASALRLLRVDAQRDGCLRSVLRALFACHFSKVEGAAAGDSRGVLHDFFAVFLAHVQDDVLAGFLQAFFFSHCAVKLWEGPAASSHSSSESVSIDWPPPPKGAKCLHFDACVRAKVDFLLRPFAAASSRFVRLVQRDAANVSLACQRRTLYAALRNAEGDRSGSGSEEASAWQRRHARKVAGGVTAVVCVAIAVVACVWFVFWARRSVRRAPPLS